MLALVVCASAILHAAPKPVDHPQAVLIPVHGAIGPGTSDFFVRQVGAAEDAGADLIIVRIDTPGGLETAMRDMVQAILAADVPIVSFVAPSGARAASAGTYLVYASHIAAMAAATSIGAATPVQIGGTPADTDADDEKKTTTSRRGPAMRRSARP